MTRRVFFALLVATLLFRLWLAAAVPITGDEAYFIWWGKIPDWGFYDHPPMVGWWLAALLQVSDASWWLRLPALLLPGVLALATARFLRRHGEDIAWTAAALVLLSPLDLWNVFITTDTPLVYFSFFSALAFLRAARDDDWRFYLLSGLLLSGAVLSKYFVALLGFAYLLHVLVSPNRKKWLGLLLCYGTTVPALALMAWWNAGHCWANVMFNFYNRNSDAAWSWQTPLLYAVTLLYVLTPPGVWLLWRRRGALLAQWREAETRALLLTWGAPLALFALLSLVKEIGLHWVLSFLPLVFIALTLALEAGARQRLVRWFVAFAALHVALIVAVSQLPLEVWRHTRIYDSIVLTFDAQQLIDRLKPYEADYVFASDGYSNAATLGYDAQRYFLVFGEGSSHARQDDILTDFRAEDGRNILILRKSRPAAGEYAPYFREVEIRQIELRGARFTVVLGRGFDYRSYRDRVLAQVRKKYYAIPRWLPQRSCYFCERYFPGTPCVSA